ncbi:MAG: hydroxymethylglutaryl-CoA synthase, partial [Leucobacter sp.]|nr:hydroxymethylglutaryl-CoA synthase [Leucobacter sp.]
DSTTAVVDGKLSVTAYLDALSAAWDDLQAQGGPNIDSIDRLLYHQPFPKMAKKAQSHFAAYTHTDLDEKLTHETRADTQTGRDTGLAAGTLYNRRLGNTYTASVFSALASLLHHDDQLAGKRVGLFSYGSGSVSEFLTGIVQPGYFDAAHRQLVTARLDSRVVLSIEDYRELHAAEHPSTVDYDTPRVTGGLFRFTGVKGQARQYERV